MHRHMLMFGAVALSGASFAQTTPAQKPFKFQEGTATFQGCVLEKYGNYVDCFWQYTRTAAGSASLTLDMKKVELYGVDGSRKDYFGYAVGESASGGTVRQNTPTTIRVKFFVPADKKVIAQLNFYDQTYRNVPILAALPGAQRPADLSRYSSRLGPCFAQGDKWLCVTEFSPK